MSNLDAVDQAAMNRLKDKESELTKELQELTVRMREATTSEEHERLVDKHYNLLQEVNQLKRQMGLIIKRNV